MSIDKAKSFSKLGNFFDSLAKHPYLCIFFACGILTAFGFGERSGINRTMVIVAVCVGVLLSFLLAFVSGLCSNAKEKLFIFTFFTALCVMSAVVFTQEQYSPSIMFWLSLVVIAAIAFFMYISGNLNERNLIILIIVAGLMLRFSYVLYTNSYNRQHDVIEFGGIHGHAAYIEYWYTNAFKLPDFDVRLFSQYYHPPLHHMIMALFLRILTFLKVDYQTACNAIQILPMMYSTLCMVVSYKIFRQLKLKGAGIITAMAIMCFHPTFIILSGSYNNDILSVLFVFCAILRTLIWYKNPTMKNIVLIALSVGLGMMSKLSAWMIAPAIAFIFLVILIKNRKNILKYIGQFAVFGAICAPLGLWWQVRSFIAYSVPLTYIPSPGGVESYQYVGNLSTLKRLLDFGSGQLSYVYDAFTVYGAPYNEYNPTVGLFKTAMFDEGTNGVSSINFPQISVTGPILFFISVALFLLATILFAVFVFSKKNGISREIKTFFGLIFAVFTLSYYIFCFKFPFTCTMNIRYCVPLILMCAIALGFCVQTNGQKSTCNKALKYTVIALSAVFSVMSAVVYTQIP